MTEEGMECSICGWVCPEDDVKERKRSHTRGRHTRHKTQNERYPESEPREINGGLGGLIIGDVEWI